MIDKYGGKCNGKIRMLSNVGPKYERKRDVQHSSS